VEQNDPITSLADRSAELRHSVRRRARRVLRADRDARPPEPPPRPFGGKLEVTYTCNLRCGFCYTDSPRRTLQRTPELSDAEWLRVADELIELGAIEAVVTGGEPLLRRDLTIEICRRLAAAGLGVTLNSNGWFVDDEAAAGLAQAPGLHVHVSLDGPAPEVHDASRGVPGSWRRAVAGMDALIRHGVAVHAVHVVTAANLERVEETLELLRVLGVRSVRVTRVIEIGAAARGDSWRVASTSIERAIAAFERRHGGDMRVVLTSGEGGVDRIRSERAPAALLVRPNGMVRIDSLNPFTFGHATADGLETCWERVREHWRDPSIASWRDSVDSPRDWPSAPVVPYLDDEVDLATPSPEDSGEDPRSAKTPRRVAADALDRDDVPRPKEYVLALALGRRYRPGDVRAAGGPERRLVRAASDGRVWRLNRSASVVFDALAPGSVGDATAALRAAFPATAPERLQADAIGVTRTLAGAGLVIPEGAAGFTAGASATPDLPQVDLR
jgi:MoaA/NifB/PqqE/SkfB family radical SAM enzyme